MATRKDSRGRVLQTGESQRADGRYQYSYSDFLGKRRYVYAKDLASLRELEKKIKIDEWSGLNTHLGQITTLNDLYDRYMKTKYGLRTSTYASYMQMYNRYVRDEFGKRIIKNICYSDIQGFYVYLLNHEKISIRSVEYVHMMLNPAFELAVKDGIISRNPAKGIFGELKRASGLSYNKRHALSIDEQKAFIEFIDGHPTWGRYHSIFQVMLGSGLRVGELCGLRWEDVDFEKRNINVNHGIVNVKAIKGGPKAHLEVSLPKSDSGIRNVPMMDKVLDGFKEEYRYAESRGFPNCIVDGYTDFIFTKENGTVFTCSRLDNVLTKVVRDYNKQENALAKIEDREPLLLPKISNHILRHTFCTRLCERDVNIKVIQTIMGHANIKITMDIYAEVSQDKQRQEMERLASELDVF